MLWALKCELSHNEEKYKNKIKWQMDREKRQRKSITLADLAFTTFSRAEESSLARRAGKGTLTNGLQKSTGDVEVAA